MRPDATRRARLPTPRLCVLGAYVVVVAVSAVAGPLAVGAWVESAAVNVVAVMLIPVYVVAMSWLSVPVLSWAMRRWPGLAEPGDRKG